MRGHRYAGAAFARDDGRHFGTPDPPNPPPAGAAPRKTDAQIQEEQRQARLGAQRKHGRRATILTRGDELGGEAPAGSVGAPGSAATLG